jgi:hypothetical protein
MNLRNARIEKLLRKNYSKLGVLGKLSDLNMRKHWLDENHKSDEISLKEEIDNKFEEILKEGLHRIGYNKGKNKSEFLSLILKG